MNNYVKLLKNDNDACIAKWKAPIIILPLFTDFSRNSRQKAGIDIHWYYVIL